jgi:hypothetical protein
MTEPKANAAVGPADDATGYGEPPLHTRFRKGQSGNSAGRPPNSARVSPCVGPMVVGRIFKIP